MNITLSYQPRPYQIPFWRYMAGGGKRAALVWHRRAGKDLTVWNWVIMAALQRVGTYHYMFPKYNQGRKIIWNGMDKSGKTFLSYIPKEMIDHPHDTDMRIHLVNGSIIQIVGSDNVDNLVGTNPVGVVLSEYAIQDPRGWQFYTPILHENDGWAVFVYTPRGKNHGHRLYEAAKTLPEWFASLLTIDDTGAVHPSVLDEDRALGFTEEHIQQEYYCSFQTANTGSYFGRDLDVAEQEGRIDYFPYDPRAPVHTAWDFGVDDATAIWFLQEHQRHLLAIDYFQDASYGLPYYAKFLQSLPYVYGIHLAPHDVNVTEFGSGMTRLETARDLGIHFTPVRKLPKQDQINAGHVLLRSIRFDRGRCDKAVATLREYEREYDEETHTFGLKPKHNRASHCADAFLTLAVGGDELYSAKAAQFGRESHREEYEEYHP